MPSTGKSQFKIRLIFIIFSIALCGILVKLFYLQILHPFSSSIDYLTTRKIPAERGKIFDVNGQPLAVNQVTYLLFSEQKKIKELDSVIRKIAPIIAMDQASIEAKINLNAHWSPIKSGVTKQEKEQIINLGLTGLGFDEEYRRYYPESSLSAQLLGFVGKNIEGGNIGYFGIEGYYDKDLMGLPGLLKSERDLIDRPIFFGTQEKIDPENGRDFYLTIDKSVQRIVKDKLISGIERYKAKEGCVIVANPNNLEILGMACLPDYDPDKYYQFSEDYYKNPAITNLYEPGSTFKPLIMAAALDAKAIKPDSIYDEKGQVRVGDYTISTWNNKYEGKISMTRIMEKSSNVGMVYIGEKLGKKKLYKYLNLYGFGQATGIDLQGENTGYLKRENQWYPIDYATATFGQGIAVTPIQMIRAFAVTINGGKLYTPHVVKKIVGAEDEQIIDNQNYERVVSVNTSEVMKKILENTVANGEVSWAAPKGYAIGGKTGTAQIPIQGHYDATKTIASFIGFAPVSKPVFMVMVILREPEASQWGSETAAPLFFEIAKELILYYNIAPGQ